MKKLSTLIIAAILMFAGSQLFAQTNIYLNLGGAIPNGDFAEGEISKSGIDWGLFDDDKDGGAGLGFNVGLKFNIATGINGLRAMITLDGIYNGLNSELREYFSDLIDDVEDDYKEFELTTQKYLNIPAMAGVNYTYNFNNKFGLFAEAGLGPNLRIITKYERYEESTSRKTTTTIEYDPKISLAYQVGAGIELSKRITIGIDYYNLGSAKVKYEYTRKVKPDGSTDHNNDTFKRITPTMVMLRVGFKL
jgi:opacity protein-like surface antigen